MMISEPNAQYNYAKPGSLSVRVAARMRRRMFDRFMWALRPSETDMVLDIGVTADESYESSNYFEALYPHKHRIVAAGIDDASFLELKHPGVQFRRADALALPFPDGSFDLVHASAVWEHVGSFENQGRMLSECLRVARRGVFLTTPNRWFPMEFHTQLPLVHWLPKSTFRALVRRTRFAAMADEGRLNLLTPAEVRTLARSHPGWRFDVESTRLLGWPSNILMVARRG
jgi:ubiquinone/menaquinone biosynthesis C-methylase UbiE